MDQYFKLSCGHIRLLEKHQSSKKIIGQSILYCKKCDGFFTLLERAPRDQHSRSYTPRP